MEIGSSESNMLPSQKESLAIASVKHVCSVTGYLEPWLREGDKFPSFDGKIIVRKKKSQKKEDITGFVPIQVKGTEVSRLHTSKTLYDVDISDIKNFALEDGVLYLVVEIDKRFKTKIFYKALLPFDLQAILSKGNKASKRLEFKPLDKGKYASIFDVCVKFLSDRTAQKGKPIIIHDSNVIADKIRFTIPQQYNKDLDDYLLNNEMYLQGQIAGQVDYAFFGKGLLVGVTREVNLDISVSGHLFYTSASIKRERNDDCIYIGKSIKLKKRSSDNFLVDLKGNLYERIHDCKFIIALIDNGGIMIGDRVVDIVFTDETSLKMKEVYERILKELLDVKSTFDYFGVELTDDFETFTDDDHQKVGRLVDAFINKKRLMAIKDGMTGVKIDILSKRFTLLLVETDGHQEILNPYSYLPKYMEPAVRLGESFAPVPFYVFLLDYDFYNDWNFEVRYIEKSIYDCAKSFASFDTSNNILLALLSGYDKTKNQSLLLACERIAGYLVDENPNNIYYLLNKLQTIKRSRELTKEENSLLRTYAKAYENDTHNANIMCAISILQENKSDFEFFFDSFDNPREKEVFTSYPIFNILPWKNESVVVKK